MRRLRARAQVRSSAALESPLSWMFLVSLLTLALIWTLYWLYVVTAVSSCVEAVGLTVAGLRHGPSLIDLFFLAFAAAATVWFFDLIREHKRSQSYVRKGVEAVLIAAGLFTVGATSEMVRPTAPGGAAPAWINENIVRHIPFFFVDAVALETAYDPKYVNADGRRWSDDFEWGAPGVDNADFPLRIFARPADLCTCWGRREERNRQENFRLNWLVAEGMITKEEAAFEREARRIGPPPVEEDWCPAVRDLARTGWTGRP